MDPFKSIGAVAAALPIFQQYSKVTRGIARRLARRIVERRLQAKGYLVAHVPIAKVCELASEYLSAHPELLDQAAEIVRGDPKLRKMAETAERERERRERKLAKAGLLDRPRPPMITPDRPVSLSDHAKTPVENASELVQPRGD
jgi:hypothetical protein